jgi:hypothetical protein
MRTEMRNGREVRILTPEEGRAFLAEMLARGGSRPPRSKQPKINVRERIARLNDEAEQGAQAVTRVN